MGKHHNHHDSNSSSSSSHHHKRKNHRKKNHHKCRTFAFDVIGDTGYSNKMEEELTILIQNVINKEDVKFVVHIGDMQTDPRGLAGLPDATVAINEAQWIPKRDRLWRINKPFIVTPGDNDWADTYQPPINNPDPISTLQAVRKVFYTNTNVPFPFQVVTQPTEFPDYSEYIENRRWYMNDILFFTVHTIAGRSNNGLLDPLQSVKDESAKRILAAVAWINRAFDVAVEKNAKGVVILSQAAINWSAPAVGFVEIINAISTRVKQNPKLKVLYICGDNHQFNVQKVLNGEPVSGTVGTPVYRAYENFTVIETPGAPRAAIGNVGLTTVAGGTGRVKVTVDPDSTDIFSISLDTHIQIVG